VGPRTGEEGGESACVSLVGARDIESSDRGWWYGEREQRGPKMVSRIVEFASPRSCKLDLFFSSYSSLYCQIT
jgi:hypothetical protein